MRIGVMGAMQIEVDNLKASMNTVVSPMCVEPLGTKKWLQQCVESARCLPRSVRRQ